MFLLQQQKLILMFHLLKSLLKNHQELVCFNQQNQKLQLITLNHQQKKKIRRRLSHSHRANHRLSGVNRLFGV